jgi:LPS O-antigen subunit length determinant protein (WzzB/FepE family)
MSDEQSRKSGIEASEPSKPGQPLNAIPDSETSVAPESGDASVLTSEADNKSGFGRLSTIDPDIYRLTWVLLRGWWIILIMVALSVVYAGYSLTKYGPTFTAHMLVREIHSNSGGLQLPSRLTNLAQGFGVAVKDDSSTSFNHFTVLLESVKFAEKLDQKYGYVKRIYAGQWDEAAQSWKAPIGWRADLDNYFRGFAPVGEWSPPTAHQLAGYVAGNISIFEVQNRHDIHKIQFQHPDPEFALEFLQNIYQEAEDELHAQELDRVSKMLTYVRNKLAKITISEYRDSLIFVLAGQEKKMLELQSGAPHIAEVIQPPVVTDRPSSPNVLVRLVLGAIVGLALGGVMVLIVAFLRNVISTRRLSRLAK